MKKYYNILNIEEWSSKEEIKKAYRKLAMKHHPDRWWDKNMFTTIKNAYDKIKDAPIKKEKGIIEIKTRISVNQFWKTITVNWHKCKLPELVYKWDFFLIKNNVKIIITDIVYEKLHYKKERNIIEIKTRINYNQIWKIIKVNWYSVKLPNEVKKWDFFWDISGNVKILITEVVKEDKSKFSNKDRNWEKINELNFRNLIKESFSSTWRWNRRSFIYSQVFFLLVLYISYTIFTIFYGMFFILTFIIFLIYLWVTLIWLIRFFQDNSIKNKE